MFHEAKLLLRNECFIIEVIYLVAVYFLQYFGDADAVKNDIGQ